MIPRFYYRTCDKCGDVERVSRDDDRFYRCAKCGSTAAWEYVHESAAIQHGRDIQKAGSL